MSNNNVIEKFNQSCNKLTQEDIESVFNLCPNKIKKVINEILDENVSTIQNLIISFIYIITGNSYRIDENLTDEENKLKSISENENKFGKELSNKLKELNTKYNII